MGLAISFANWHPNLHFHYNNRSRFVVYFPVTEDLYTLMSQRLKTSYWEDKTH
jgi:hypothetical protein